MNFQRIKLFKDRKQIIQSVLDIYKNVKINELTIIAQLNDESIEFYVLSDEEIKKKCFPDKSIVEIKMVNCGVCKYHIISYEELQKKLIYNDEYYWSICNNSYIVIDLLNRYKEIVKTAKYKKNWWPIFKKIFY